MKMVSIYATLLLFAISVLCSEYGRTSTAGRVRAPTCSHGSGGFVVVAFAPSSSSVMRGLSVSKMRSKSSGVAPSPSLSKNSIKPSGNLKYSYSSVTLNMSSEQVTHTGGCHCGAVCFEADSQIDATVQVCNCSICSMTNYVHLIVPKSKFRLLKGEESLKTYTFNSGVAQHLFCEKCGIKSFYVPRSNPDGFSVNVNCIKSDTTSKLQREDFDGRNWEKHAHSLKHLSAEDTADDED